MTQGGERSNGRGAVRLRIAGFFADDLRFGMVLTV